MLGGCEARPAAAAGTTRPMSCWAMPVTISRSSVLTNSTLGGSVRGLFPRPRATMASATEGRARPWPTRVRGGRRGQRIGAVRRARHLFHAGTEDAHEQAVLAHLLELGGQRGEAAGVTERGERHGAGRLVARDGLQAAGLVEQALGRDGLDLVLVAHHGER